MTREELDISNDTNISGAGKVTKERHSTHNDNIADYIDDEIDIVKSMPNAITFTMVSDGNSITYTDLIGRPVSFIILDDAVKNTGFIKLPVSDTLSFTDGTTFSTGQKLTVSFV